MKARLSLFIFLVGSCFASLAQPAFIKDSLDAFITKGMQDWQIPGLAIAIVKDGKTVIMKGFGVSNLETKTPVDENTLFMIASNSKLFTATALAQLEYNKKLSLDDKIIQYFPDFKLYDSTTTALVNIKDMLSHHLGTKTFQGDFTFWNSSLTRREVIYKMRLLKPGQQFRQSYGYCNSCFVTAGEIIPAVSGMPWEVYVYDSLLVPLGMSNTHTLGQGMDQMPNAASPYTNGFSNDLKLIPYDNVDNIGPAGSMVSSVKDISKWLLMQLDSGRYNGKRILPWNVIDRTRQMQTIISSRKSDLYPSHIVGYNLGLLQRDYNGKQVYWHTGGADGFVTNTCFVPEEKLGITILTNNDNQQFFEILRYQVLDAYLGVTGTNRNQKALAGFKEEHAALVKKTDSLKARVRGSQPPLSLSAYAGTFTNELMGDIEISVSNKGLLIQFPHHNGLVARLQYMDHEEWLLTYNNAAFGIFPVRFKTAGDKVISTEIKCNDFIEYDAYLFTKQ
ncbi:serine hydrolase [Panacibacter sp. DH6]|uniref:Serine hydrolase n=1 Tax=Panacibacter microcysteis TaxID=2793269 RepID=A0A931GVF0_9BACT|nr:serine hydrolase [Panacibacter microcysteis]MBG9377741.1 serine hydrolase [Panacibacter microcysteis]